LQQRPSKGWGSAAQVRNVPHATTSFVQTAKRILKKHPRVPVWQLAQSVQRSSYGGRYHVREPDARALIAKLK
jgi:hypothetical protein